MKELDSIEEIKDKIINANGTLIFRWSVKSGFFGGIDEKTENYISEFKELIDEGFIEWKSSKIKTTYKGKSVLNTVLDRFDQIINSKH